MSSIEVKKLDTEIDRLSDLPDGLLCHILSYLPITDAVRTSILSTRWKNLYTLVSSLNLDDVYHHGEGFMNIVDNVLFARKRIDLDKFLLRCQQAVDPLRAEGWVQYALWHSVRELDLNLFYLWFTVPAGLFTCKTLVSLKLTMNNNFVLKIPCKVSLPSLKILCIMAAVFSDSVERLFSSCSALEELVLHSCVYRNISRLKVFNSTLKRLTVCHIPYTRFQNEVLINAPSLVYLKLDHFIAKNHLLIDLHSLVEAYIDFGCASIKTDLIRGLRQVQSLHLSGPFSEAFLPGQGPIPTLENMTSLKIGKFCSRGWVRVLNLTPCLETLVFEEIRYIEENITNPSKQVPPCLISRMKTIKFLSFGGKKSEVLMVKYFLMHGQVLENMIIHVNAPQLKVTKELLKFPRVSKKCKVVMTFSVNGVSY